MTNDSSTGGYLAPSPPPAPQPLEDDALDNFLQQVVVQLTGIPGQKVFPRWQENQPNIPPLGVNWASIGVTEQDTSSQGFAYEAHDPVLLNPFPPLPTPAPTPPPNGYDIQIQHELLEILCSFYGPAARTNAALVRDGLQVAQNREALQLAGMAFVGSGKITAVPSLVNSQWYSRYDMPITIRREIVRNYPILDLVSLQVTLRSDQGFTVTTTTT